MVSFTAGSRVLIKRSNDIESIAIILYVLIDKYMVFWREKDEQGNYVNRLKQVRKANIKAYNQFSWKSKILSFSIFYCFIFIFFYGAYEKYSIAFTVFIFFLLFKFLFNFFKYQLKMFKECNEKNKSYWFFTKDCTSLTFWESLILHTRKSLSLISGLPGDCINSFFSALTDGYLFFIIGSVCSIILFYQGGQNNFFYILFKCLRFIKNLYFNLY